MFGTLFAYLLQNLTDLSIIYSVLWQIKSKKYAANILLFYRMDDYAISLDQNFNNNTTNQNHQHLFASVFGFRLFLSAVCAFCSIDLRHFTTPPHMSRVTPTLALVSGLSSSLSLAKIGLPTSDPTLHLALLTTYSLHTRTSSHIKQT